MGILMRRAATAALLLGACVAARPCQADMVTWQFVEIGGVVGATMTLNSPPVDLTPGAAWTATTVDLLDFTILDAALGAVGSYNINLNVASILEGIGPDFINVHEISGQNAAGDTAISNISGTLDASDLGVATVGGPFNSVNGNWVLAPAVVPEPSSLVTAGIGVLMGAGWTLRRRRTTAATA